ncbi:hypothetical protein ZWY2020_031369 [Hordeum vulgare]|nr:hypothetical protein ZWY2020_031369 [Hordeum vulgare]
MADSKKVAMAGGKDRFEDLPDHVLELLLSFLDALNAVRTSVLARRWRNLWKSVPVLRFEPYSNCFDPYSNFGSAENFNNFVNKVLECRDQTSPLRECQINSYLYGLVTFELEDCEGWTPLLENVPSLVTSSIIIGVLECNDSCDEEKYLGDCGVESCEGCYVEDDCSVILEGLSGATNLKLISVYSMYSPILEKLTLQFLPYKEFGIDSSESYNPSEYFLVSKHLMIVEIHCRKKDKMIFQIEKILAFSFEQKELIS